MEKKFCINCGAEIKDNNQFCIECGKPVSKPETPPSATASTPASEPAPISEPETVSVSQEVVTEVDKPTETSEPVVERAPAPAQAPEPEVRQEPIVPKKEKPQLTPEEKAARQKKIKKIAIIAAVVAALIAGTAIGVTMFMRKQAYDKLATFDPESQSGEVKTVSEEEAQKILDKAAKESSEKSEKETKKKLAEFNKKLYGVWEAENCTLTFKKDGTFEDLDEGQKKPYTGTYKITYDEITDSFVLTGKYKKSDVFADVFIEEGRNIMISKDGKLIIGEEDGSTYDPYTKKS